MSGSSPAISVQGLRKSYGTVEALRGIDLRVANGEVFALLGPNGAGKTSAVEIMEGYRSRDAGEVRVLGLDPAAHPAALRERVGIVLQSTGLSRYLSVRETVELFAGYYRRPRPIDEVLALVGLTDLAGRRITKLSGGERRRLDLAVALVGDPELLFLDEPTTGFDPSARRQAWEVVRGLTGLGKTILLTTHYMDEAQELADRLAVIAHGEIVAEGTPQTLGGRDVGRSSIRFSLPEGCELPDRFGAHRAGPGYELQTESATRLMHELSSWALSADVDLVGLEVRPPSLEEVYLELTREAEAA
ncbi:MAG TPA: ABC transporter ATP-binding protein [Candidatus Limnocylindria bacterium]|nr:ABC transporter ATP-binding protein [Candidatus Limnocylindria bacterium]